MNPEVDTMEILREIILELDKRVDDLEYRVIQLEGGVSEQR